MLILRTANIQGQDQNLLQRLYTSWPDLVNGDDNKFWEKEWNKHGGCSENSYDEVPYFTLAADLKDRFDVYGHLLARYPPSLTTAYDWRTISGTINSYTGKEPELTCESYKGNNLKLGEVRICFDQKGAAVIDCPPRPSTATHKNYNLCSIRSPFGGMVYFPI